MWPCTFWQKRDTSPPWPALPPQLQDDEVVGTLPAVAPSCGPYPMTVDSERQLPKASVVRKTCRGDTDKSLRAVMSQSLGWFWIFPTATSIFRITALSLLVLNPKATFSVTVADIVFSESKWIYSRGGYLTSRTEVGVVWASIYLASWTKSQAWSHSGRDL